MKKTLLLTTLALTAGMARAGIVGSNVSTSGASFQYLATPPSAVGNNNININKTLFAFDEQQNVLFGNAPTVDLGGPIAANTLVSSYYVYFDPLNSQGMQAELTFSDTILGVYYHKGTKDVGATSGTGLRGSQDNFGLTSGVTYTYHNLTGLESVDRGNTSIDVANPNVLKLKWNASTPGDHIRVITAAVPEPETYAMLLAGLGVMGAIARRRKAARA